MPYPLDIPNVRPCATSDPATGQLVLGEQAAHATISQLVLRLPEGVIFSFYDRLFPSPSDPGAYVSFSRVGPSYTMSRGNHGWSTARESITPDDLIAYFWRCKAFNHGKAVDEVMSCHHTPGS